MGQNKLNSLMKTTVEKGGLSSERLTNHSTRKCTIQKLNDSDIPPSHIMQLSGHRNVQSINNYSHISQQKQKNMSRILSATSTEPAAKLHRTLATERVKLKLCLVVFTYQAVLQCLEQVYLAEQSFMEDALTFP